MKLFLALILITGLITSCAAKKEEEELASKTTANYVYLTANIVGSNGKILAYSLNTTTGILTEVEQQDALVNPKSMAITSDGKFMYVTNYTGIQVFSIAAATGKLTLVESETENISDARNILLSPDDGYLYVETRASSVSTIRVFSIASDGQITSTTNLDLGRNMYSMTMNTAGTKMYFVGADGASSNASFIHIAARSTADGSITSETVTLVPSGSTYASAATLSRDGGRIYVANTQSLFGRIGKVTLDSDGNIDLTTAITNEIFNSGAELLLHPTLDILYSNIGAGTPGIQGHTIATDGALTLGDFTADTSASSTWELKFTSDAATLLNSYSAGLSTYTVDSAGVVTKAGELTVSALGATVNATGVSTIKILY